MMKVIVPQIILTAVGFSTFWLSPSCGERLGLAVTVPLAVAVYDLLTFSQLPVSNHVTLVSALGMTAFLFCMVRAQASPVLCCAVLRYALLSCPQPKSHT